MVQTPPSNTLQYSLQQPLIPLLFWFGKSVYIFLFESHWIKVIFAVQTNWLAKNKAVIFCFLIPSMVLYFCQAKSDYYKCFSYINFYCWILLFSYVVICVSAFCLFIPVVSFSHCLPTITLIATYETIPH